MLADYYDEFEGLPTKVTYEFDNVIGTVDTKILDDNGDVFVIDETKDDSQFIKDCSQEELNKLSDFMANFLDRYFRFIAGVGDPMYSYEQLAQYMELGSELDERCKVNMDGLSWSIPLPSV